VELWEGEKTVAKKGAPIGNRNAAGPHSAYDKGGFAGSVSTLVGGPLGAGLAGTYAGFSKSKLGGQRTARGAAAAGSLLGAAAALTSGATHLGAMAGASTGKRHLLNPFKKSTVNRNAAIGAALTTVGGAALGAGVNWASAKLSNKVASRVSRTHRK
jgi:hypothetical protein